MSRENIQIEMMAKQRFMNMFDPAQGQEWKKYNNQLADEQFMRMINAKYVFSEEWIVSF